MIAPHLDTIMRIDIMKYYTLWSILVISLVFNMYQFVGTTILFDQLEVCQQKHATERNRQDVIQAYLTSKYAVQPAEASRLAEYFLEAGRDYRLDPYLLAAQSYAESSFINNALSNKGAVGLMQIMPRYWATGQIKFIKNVEDLYNPRLNIRAGAYILRHYLDRTGDINMALRAYHGGLNAVHNPRLSTVHYVHTIQTRYQSI